MFARYGGAVVWGPAKSIGRVKGSDDSATLGSLPALLQQQAAVIQSLQSDVTALETRLAASEATLAAQEQEITSLKSRVAATSTAGRLVT